MTASSSRVQRLPETLDELETLRRLAHTLASSCSLDETLEAAATWTRAALGWDHAAAALSVPGSRGRLRVAARAGAWQAGNATLRRAAHAARETRRASLRRPVGSVHAALPLLARDDSVGVLEVVAPRATVEHRWGTIETMASMIATAVRAATEAPPERRDPRGEISVAWAAHELRSPLLATAAALDRVQSRPGALPGEEERGLVARSHEELLGLARSCEDLLEWAAGRRTLQPRRADVVRIVREAVVASCLEMRQQRVEVISPARVPAVVDPVHLRSAVANLIRNALAYTPDDDVIAVTVIRDGDRVRIAIGDSGPGMSPTEIRTVFRPLVRGECAPSNPSGRGLGLFIARRVVEAHRGTMEVSSNGRQGTVFRLDLPAGGPR